MAAAISLTAASKGLGVALRGLAHPADLAHELERGFLDLLRRALTITGAQTLDASTHLSWAPLASIARLSLA